MKKGSILFLPLTLLLLLSPASVFAQVMSVITVNHHELNNGVVVLHILKEGKSYELKCNEGLAGCIPLADGTYVMVELPKNYGMYECSNVQLYPELTTTPEPEKRLGDYCLAEK